MTRMSRANDIKISVTGNKLGASAKAVKFEIKKIGTGELVKPITTWFPFSQVVKSTTSTTQVDVDTLLVSEWIMKEKKLIGPGSEEYVQYVGQKDSAPEVSSEHGHDEDEGYNYDDVGF